MKFMLSLSQANAGQQSVRVTKLCVVSYGVLQSLCVLPASCAVCLEYPSFLQHALSPLSPSLSLVTVSIDECGGHGISTDSVSVTVLCHVFLNFYLQF